jgi:carotenoid cleavage dioxygenase
MTVVQTEPVTNRYLSGNYAPVTEEVTAAELEVTGRLPEQLSGRYLRIGPNPITPPDPGAYHWFTGDGMAHGIRLRDGRADWYRNRWVRSTKVSDALGEEPAPGPRHAMFDGANTNIIGHAGRTFAIVEAGGHPVELSYELDTVAHTDFDGTLPNGFTAHPKRDPETGELHAMAYYWELPYVQYLCVDASGRVRRWEPIEVAGSPMMHDMSLTERHVVIYDLPVTFQLEAAMGGEPFPYRWDEGYGARVGVMPREGGNADVVWLDVEPCYVFHPLNAYDVDDGHGLVLDVVRHPRMFDRNPRGFDDGPPNLWRWTVDLRSRSIKEEQLHDRAQEFPRVDERVVSRPHRYGYAASLSASDDVVDFDGNALLKHDLDTGATIAHDFGRGRGAGEAVFVPSSDGAGEDDGFVMSLVYDAATDRSDLVILSAQDFDGEPVATVHLPVRVPYGFHGNWVPDEA